MQTDVNESVQQMKDGTHTKPLFIKHLALSDWEIVEQIKAGNQFETAADAVRWALRKAAGRI